MSYTNIFFSLIVGLIAVQTIKACSPLCPEITMTLEMTAEDVTLKNIAKNAPSNCVCKEKAVPNKWIMRGNAYGACDRPVCLAQPLGKNIRMFEGPRCPPILMAHPEETMLQYWTRIHDDQANAPTDGWCPPGQQKWIVYGSVIGKDRDTCTCVNNFYWVESKQPCSKCLI